MFKNIIMFIIGISGGIVVGSSVAAFITLLDIIPRLVQVSNTRKYIGVYERVIILSIVGITIVTFLNLNITFSKFILIPIGLTMGVFVGLLAAALAEVVNVIPVLSKRLNIEEYTVFVLISLVLGKVTGSLIQWLLLVKYY